MATTVASENTAFAALRPISRNRTYVPLVHQLIMVASGIGTRLIPIVSFSQEPSLLLDSFLAKTNRRLGSLSFSKY